MDDELLYPDWWLWLLLLTLVVVLALAACKLMLEFPGLLDWQWMPPDPEDPARRAARAIYHPLLWAGREVVRKVSRTGRRHGSKTSTNNNERSFFQQRMVVMLCWVVQVGRRGAGPGAQAGNGAGRTGGRQRGPPRHRVVTAPL